MNKRGTGRSFRRLLSLPDGVAVLVRCLDSPDRGDPQPDRRG